MEDPKRLTLTVDTRKENSIRTQSLWEEVRPDGALPSRRSYHSACEINNYLVIYGGQDMTEGVYDDLWIINLSPNSGYGIAWLEMQTTGDKPPHLCRHTAISHNSKMHVFGGTNLFDEFNNVWILDIESRNWQCVRPNNEELPPPMDSHSAVQYLDQASHPNMLIFGGFIHGARSNNVFRFRLDTHAWDIPRISGTPPAERSGHSAIVYNNAMYIFAGISESTDSLNDLWKLDLDTMIWRQVDMRGGLPAPRSGHTVSVHKDVMLIFGGIKEITRETNDMYTFNLTTGIWGPIQFEIQVEDPVSAADVEEFKRQGKTTKQGKSPVIKEPSSPARRRRTLYDGPVSPTVGFVKGRVPHARDGHSATMIQDKIYIFGGDRHQMPFNDLYSYQVHEETIKTPLLHS